MKNKISGKERFMANVEISVETNGVVGYYHYTKSISPIKRLYVKSD